MSDYKKLLNALTLTNIKALVRTYISHVKFTVAKKTKDELIEHIMKHTDYVGGKVVSKPITFDMVKNKEKVKKEKVVKENKDKKDNDVDDIIKNIDLDRLDLIRVPKKNDATSDYEFFKIITEPFKKYFILKNINPRSSRDFEKVFYNKKYNKDLTKLINLLKLDFNAVSELVDYGQTHVNIKKKEEKMEDIKPKKIVKAKKETKKQEMMEDMKPKKERVADPNFDENFALKRAPPKTTKEEYAKQAKEEEIKKRNDPLTIIFSKELIKNVDKFKDFKIGNKNDDFLVSYVVGLIKDGKDYYHTYDKKESDDVRKVVDKMMKHIK